MNYGYIRVSSRDQNDDRQRIVMEEAGITEKNLFVDKLSGKDFNRPAYRKLKRKLKKGDMLYIKSIDRLGRNYEEIIAQWREITKDIKADIMVIDMPLLNTSMGKDLLGTLISDLVLQLLSFVAENERDNIRQRQREGIEAAKRRGVKFGRPKVPTPENFERIIEEWRMGDIGRLQAIARTGLTEGTFYNKLKEMAN